MTAELRHRPPPPPELGDCSNCAYSVPEVMDFDVAGDENPTPVLECHRYPPQAVVVGPVGDPGELAAQSVAMLWPQVHGGDWCGEWGPE